MELEKLHFLLPVNVLTVWHVGSTELVGNVMYKSYLG